MGLTELRPRSLREGNWPAGAGIFEAGLYRLENCKLDSTAVGEGLAEIGVR